MRPALKPGRIPCVVMSCRHTAPADKYPAGAEIICGDCRRLANRSDRRRLARIRRLVGRLGLQDAAWDDIKPGSYERKALLLWDRLWRRVVTQATEARLGIG